MTRYFALLLLGAFALTGALAQGFDEEDEIPVPTTTRPTTTPRPRRNLDDTVLSLSRAPRWTFAAGPFGPRNWRKKYPKCRQLLQSPINIETKRVISSVLKPLKFKNIELPLNDVTIANLFRYGGIDFTRSNPRVSISGGPLPGKVKYYLSFAYITVGKNRTNGSLHAVNGKKAPFEIGFIFNPRKNTTIETVHHGSEVIVHFLGKISPQDNPNYAPIVNGLKKVVKGGSTTKCPQLKSLRSLFPRKTWELNYFTYTGSSVVPPCKEGRIRIVYQRTIRISAKQLKAFRGLYNEQNKYIWNNYRPTQKSKFVQVFSSVERVPKPTTTTRRPTTTGAANIVEDPYAPLPTKPTTTRSTTIRNVVPTTEEPYYKK